MVTGPLYSQFENQEKDPEKLFNKGFHLLSVDLTKAIDYITKSLEIDSLNPDGYYFRGIAFYKQDELDKALKDFNTANKLDQGLHLIHVYKGFIFRKKEEYDSAVVNFNRYIQHNPHDTSAYSLVLRGKMKQKSGDIEGAIEDIDIAMELDSIKENYHYYKFLAYFEERNFNRAREQLDHAQELNPDFYGYYYYRGNTYFEEKKFKLALQQYNIAIEMKVDNGDLYFHRGLTEKELNNNKAAILDFDTAIAYNENDGEYYFHRGYAKLALGKRREACDDWYTAGSLGYYEDFEKIKEVCEQ